MEKIFPFFFAHPKAPTNRPLPTPPCASLLHPERSSQIISLLHQKPSRPTSHSSGLPHSPGPAPRPGHTSTVGLLPPHQQRPQASCQAQYRCVQSRCNSQTLLLQSTAAYFPLRKVRVEILLSSYPTAACVLDLFKPVQAISECQAAASQSRGPSQSGVTWCPSTCTDASLQRDWRPRITNPGGTTMKSCLALLLHFTNQPPAVSAKHTRRERSGAKAEHEGKGAIGTSSFYPHLLETSLQSTSKGSYPF